MQRELQEPQEELAVQGLKALYSKQAEQELLQTVREFHTCKQEEGQFISSHVLKMKGYIDNMERLGQPVGQNLAVSVILVSLNKDFDSFMQSYNMHDMRKTVNELHAMPKLHEETLPKKDANPALHAIPAERVQKNQKNKPHKAAKGGGSWLQWFLWKLQNGWATTDQIGFWIRLMNCAQRWPVPLLPFEKRTQKQKPAPVARFYYYSVDLGEMLSKEVEIADEDNGSGRILNLQEYRLYKSDILPLVGEGGNFDRKRRRDGNDDMHGDGRKRAR
nr:zinc finger, CCHC-type [Tanacetum cinerariifolium]